MKFTARNRLGESYLAVGGGTKRETITKAGQLALAATAVVTSEDGACLSEDWPDFTSFCTKVSWFLRKVIAVEQYDAEQLGYLSFTRCENILVLCHQTHAGDATDKHPSYLYGMIEDDKSRHGWFPESKVKVTAL